jgi:nuclear pore complex protein Nup107
VLLRAVTYESLIKMAPMTRRSQAAASAAASTTAPATANSTTGISKPVTRRSRAPVTTSAATRKDQSNSWELLDRESSHDNNEDIGSAHGAATAKASDMDFSTTTRTTRGAAQNAADSLRDIADRVGKEVEVFAETLDRFFDNLPTAQDQYDAAHDLVLEFKGIADMAVEDLKKGHEREIREQLRTEWSEQAHLSAFESAGRSKARSITAFGGAAAERKREQVEELRLCQEEADTWELFRIVLETHYNPNTASREQEKQEKLAKLSNVHRYTSESELYDRFLAEDDLARERHMVKTWLEETAEHQKSDVEGIVTELEERAGASKGSWTRGWMHTREKIKAEKRMRTWPQPDSSPLPQIRRTDNNEMLITSLDPDAPARQERTLEKQDAYIERAFWIACYEMLRRGKPWNEVCDWCEERKEGWRAVAMGKTMATSETASNMAWRKMCFLASRSESVGDYEAAVYGLLGGNVEAVKKISRSVDDHLYAHYNAILIQQFDHYLQTNYPRHIPQALAKHARTQDSVADANAAQLEILTLINGLRKTSTTKHESTTPIKMLQSYILANECESLVHTVGTAISEAKNISGNPDDMTNRIRALVKYGSGYAEDKIVTDLRSLRITTHICLVLQVLRTGELDPGQVDIEDNVVDAYIQELRTAGKRDNTPTYASRLQPERYTIALSRVFQDVSSPKERQELLSLVEAFGLSPKDILWELTNFLQDELFGTRTQAKALRILEPSDEDLYPGQRIKAGSLPSEVAPQEEAFVMSFEWFLQAQGHWTETFAALNKGLRDCLCKCRLPCHFRNKTIPANSYTQTPAASPAHAPSSRPTRTTSSRSKSRTPCSAAPSTSPPTTAAAPKRAQCGTSCTASRAPTTTWSSWCTPSKPSPTGAKKKSSTATKCPSPPACPPRSNTPTKASRPAWRRSCRAISSTTPTKKTRRTLRLCLRASGICISLRRLLLTILFCTRRATSLRARVC